MVINVKMARLYNLWQQWLGKEAMPKKSMSFYVQMGSYRIQERDWEEDGERDQKGVQLGKATERFTCSPNLHFHVPTN